MMEESLNSQISMSRDIIDAIIDDDIVAFERHFSSCALIDTPNVLDKIIQYDAVKIFTLIGCNLDILQHDTQRLDRYIQRCINLGGPKILTKLVRGRHTPHKHIKATIRHNHTLLSVFREQGLITDIPDYVHYAMKHDCYPAFKYLYNMLDKNQRTIYITHAACNDVDTDRYLRFLLNAGCPIDYPTCVDTAVQNGFIDQLRLLLERTTISDCAKYYTDEYMSKHVFFANTKRSARRDYPACREFLTEKCSSDTWSHGNTEPVFVVNETEYDLNAKYAAW